MPLGIPLHIKSKALSEGSQTLEDQQIQATQKNNSRREHMQRTHSGQGPFMLSRKYNLKELLTSLSKGSETNVSRHCVAFPLGFL